MISYSTSDVLYCRYKYPIGDDDDIRDPHDEVRGGDWGQGKHGKGKTGCWRKNRV